MYERNGKIQVNKQDLDKIHKCVVDHLKKSIEILEEMAEEHEGFKMWYFIPGTLGFRIKQITQSLRIIIKEVVSVTIQARKREN